jgi:hypothetical protein
VRLEDEGLLAGVFAVCLCSTKEKTISMAPSKSKATAFKIDAPGFPGLPSW